ATSNSPNVSREVGSPSVGSNGPSRDGFSMRRDYRTSPPPCQGDQDCRRVDHLPDRFNRGDVDLNRLAVKASPHSTTTVASCGDGLPAVGC
ncbi:MAG: hypothetical protein KKE86_03315, partial [Planctomycetes bacterium]|nr:hypothetical protein [Planctomycetota bacterium]